MFRIRPCASMAGDERVELRIAPMAGLPRARPMREPRTRPVAASGEFFWQSSSFTAFAWWVLVC